jgi:hypothetical protein
MTKDQREELAHLKREISQPKHQILDILRRVESISPSQGEQLGRILARLEDWQNK